MLQVMRTTFAESYLNIRKVQLATKLRYMIVRAAYFIVGILSILATSEDNQ